MIEDTDYGGSNGMYRQQVPLRPPPMMPPTSIRTSISPRFDNIASRSSSVPWSPVQIDGNPYERSVYERPTVDPMSNNHMYPKSSDVWTNNYSNNKPSDGWTNNNPNMRPPDVWTNNNPNVRPSDVWTNNNPNMRPPDVWTNNNPSMKPSDGWTNSNIFTKSTEIWTNNNGQIKPVDSMSPNNNVPPKPVESWSTINNAQVKPYEPWSPSRNGQSKPPEPMSPSTIFPKTTESTLISNNSSNIPMVKSLDKNSGPSTGKCSPNCKLGLLGFAIGFLAVGIALAVVLVLWLRQ